MKLNNTTKRSNKGMTLLELTVVILVLLSLISILFIGARAWKKGSDRAGCILNIRNVQQAVRGDQNMKGKVPGATGLVVADIFGSDGYLNAAPTCPSAGTAYTGIASTTYPAIGTTYIVCADADYASEHVPADSGQW
jgi:prepilin-type N-terminal cleavage/methylation domain-containing protein